MIKNDNCQDLTPLVFLAPDPQLVANVAHFLWEWEDSAELNSEFAGRLVRYILGWTKGSNSAVKSSN